MDVTTITGILLGIGAIILGNSLEGGHFESLLQLTAALIVLGGTLGAVIVSHKRTNLLLAWDLMRLSFRKDDEEERARLSQEIADAAILARKETLLSLEAKIPSFSHPYLQSMIRLIVDGVDPQIIRRVFETKIDVEEERLLRGAKVWSDAGGYAPTIGILGAVLGLIHVMGNLSNTAELGRGIAVAFVATIYGVGSANLLFLPIGNKIKNKIFDERDTKEMILEGAIAIAEGLNPYIVREKMKSFNVPVEGPDAQI